jgi:hypothetical protein
MGGTWGGSGGSGGGSFGGFGGTGGSGNAPSGGGAPGGGGSGNTGNITITAENMIDDMEADTGSIKAQQGRVGAWYTYNDETVGGTQTPAMGATFLPEAITGGANGGTHAAHTSGTGFSTWGAGMGFDLNNNGSSKQIYSVAGKTGIAFWGRGGHAIRVKVLTADTTPIAEGGTCTTSCGDNHGMVFTLTQSLQQFALPFSSLVQEGWGAAVAFAPDKVIGVQFQVVANVPFDFWVDDIGLY